MRAFFFLTSILLVTFGKAQMVDTCLIINEISMKPCCLLTGQKTREYVELFNSSNTDTIDINGWFIRTDLNNNPLLPVYGQDEIVTWSSRFLGSPNDLVAGPIITNTTKIPPRTFAVIFSPQWNTSMLNLFDIADSTIALTLNNFNYWGANGPGGINNGLLNNSGDFVALFNASPLLPTSIQIDSIGWNGVQSTVGFSLQRDDDCVYRFYKDELINPAVGYNVDLDSTLLFANSPGAHNTLVNDTSELLIITSDDTICLGENISFSYTEPYSCTAFSYLWNFGDAMSGTADTSSSPLPNHVYSSAGNHVVSLFVTSGCFTDTVYTSIKVNANITFSQSLSICSGQSITVGSNVYTTTGTYIDTLIAVSGCDSVITTNLTVSSNITFSQSLSICSGQSITVGSNVYTTTGTYIDTLIAVSGCDSVITTNLTVSSNITFSQSLSICSGQSMTVGSNVYNTTGTYIDTLIAVGGCDSVITTNLTVSSNITFSQSLSICSGQSITVGSNVYNTTGTYIDTLIAVGGCDSIVNTNLTVNSVTTNFTASPTFGNAPLTVSFINNSSMGSNFIYSWDFGNGETSVVFIPADVIYTTFGSISVVLIVTDSVSGCSDTVSISLDIMEKSSLIIPNVFTPNGDGSNDIFTISGVNLKSVTGEIYNRWGQKLYNWDAVNGGWDGKTSSGKNASEGTYFYIIKIERIDDKKIEKTGIFTLFR